MTDGRRFRILTVVDHSTREWLARVADTAISGRRVARELTHLVQGHGRLETILGSSPRTSDNGAEPTSNAILEWADDMRIGWRSSRPESRSRTASTKSFNDRVYAELLNETSFRSLGHARAMLGDWRRDYNGQRPHSKLGWLTPRGYADALSGHAGALRYARAPRPRLLPPTTNKAQITPDTRYNRMRNGSHKAGYIRLTAGSQASSLPLAGVQERSNKVEGLTSYVPPMIRS